MAFFFFHFFPRLFFHTCLLRIEMAVWGACLFACVCVCGGGGVCTRAQWADVVAGQKRKALLKKCNISLATDKIFFFASGPM
jgi:hypothetical protein